MLRCLPVLIGALLVAGCFTFGQVERRLTWKCYSGGTLIYEGELTFDKKALAWVDDDGFVVHVSGDCIGHEVRTVKSTRSETSKERCTKRCAGVPTYRREKCLEGCK